MVGLILNRDITPELITTLLNMPEFHILTIHTLDYELIDEPAIRRFLQANKIDILREENPNDNYEFPVATNTQLLLDLTSANPLRIADLPIQFTDLRQIATTLKSLELIGIEIPGSTRPEENESTDEDEDEIDNLTEAARTITEALNEFPRLRVKLWTDQKDLITQFLDMYSGPPDRLITE